MSICRSVESLACFKEHGEGDTYTHSSLLPTLSLFLLCRGKQHEQQGLHPVREPHLLSIKVDSGQTGE